MTKNELTKLQKPELLPAIKTSLNADLFPKHYEKNFQPSLTIPDQSMSMREIMDRYASGLGFDGVKVPIYEGEEFMPDLAHMDLADREEYLRQAEEELEEIKSRLDLKAKEQLQKEEEKKIEEKIKDALKRAKRGQNPDPADPTDIPFEDRPSTNIP